MGHSAPNGQDGRSTPLCPKGMNDRVSGGEGEEEKWLKKWPFYGAFVGLEVERCPCSRTFVRA